MATMRFQQALTMLGVRKVKFSVSQENYQIGNSNLTSSGLDGLGVNTVFRRNYTLPPVGTGAGRGGGAGGSVRESGGSLGQYGAAQEEEYFFNKRKEQLEKLKSKMKQERKSPEIKRKDDK